MNQMQQHLLFPSYLNSPPKPQPHRITLLPPLHATITTTTPAAATTTTSRAVIVGGGLAGLAAATHLKASSIPFILIESSSTLGGRVVTDVKDGFLLDRGFQIFLTSYPECQKLLDYTSLNLQPFYPGALVYHTGQFHLLSDPFRLPLRSLSSLFSPIGTIADKILIATTRLKAAATPDDVILSSPERTIADHLKSIGFSPSIVESFLRPFFAGIFFDTDLDTSSRLFELVFKRLALGENAIPEAGIGAIPKQLAARLSTDSILLDTRVIAVNPVNGTNSTSATVTLENGNVVVADLGVIVAVEQPEAERLLPGQVLDPTKPKEERNSRSTVCIYFSAARAPIKDPILVLNGSGEGIVNNMFFASNVAKSYAPEGKVLVSVSLVGAFSDRSDDELVDEVVRELGGWFGSDVVRSWRHLRTYRIGFAQPIQTPPTNPGGRDPRVDKGVYVCGDHWSSATFDGALVSGRKAAEALVKDLITVSKVKV